MKKQLMHLLLGLCAASTAVAAESAANMALVARPSASHVSGDAKLTALNDGMEPTRSDLREHGSYGNWPKTGTQWVQYDWSKPIAVDAVEVYWWDDARGIRLPSAARLLYWDGEAFVPVKTSSELGVEADGFNTLAFKEITTDKLRLEFDGTAEFSTGILEWKVLDSGKSPVFPPSVKAGIDRSVVLDGKTYLRGAIKTLKGEGHVRWSKQSGPGWVTFDDPEALNTAASFSEVGEYVLRLTGMGGGETTTDSLSVKVVQGPPAENLQPVDTMPYTINNDLWNDWAKRIIVGWIPHSIEKINDPELPEGGINNFVEAARKLEGKEHGEHRGYSFANAWVYNTMESICVALMVDPRGDPEVIESQKALRKTLDEWIPLILAAQEPDGYLQTMFTLSDRERWSEEHREDHEGYVAGYFLEAAISHYMLTGGEDLRLYNAAKRLADCWADNIGPGPGKQVWWDEHQGMEIALVRFGRFVNTVEDAGNGDKYIQLSKFLLDSRSGGNEYSQSHVPVTEQYEAVGHAVRASYSYAAMSDVAMETHDTDYQSAVISLFDNMINRKYYATGGIGSGETSEGFGPDYSLPHTAYAESCSSCGLIFFEHKLNMAYHDSQYADLYEETIYNALLGSLDLNGENFYYQNPLTSYGGRYPWHICPCCIGNIPRVLLMLPTWTYVKDSDNLYVNMFLGSRITVSDVGGTDIEMVQETDYPWDGKVSITVNPELTVPFGIRIRVPNREVSELYTVEPKADGILWMKVNGQTVDPVIEDGYAILKRTWTKGDTIEFELPMEIQQVRASDKVVATRGQVALRYGPLIYTFESADQSLDKEFDPEATLEAEWMPRMLDGIVAIRGKWSDGSDLLAIPYYARSNRIDGVNSDRAGFGGPGAVGGGDSQRSGEGPTSKVWVDEKSE